MRDDARLATTQTGPPNADEKHHELAALLRRSQRYEAVGRLTAGFAHDFNNVAAVVLGNINFLERHLQENPQALQRLSFVREAANRGAKLASQVLSLAGREKLEPEPISINEVVESLTTILHHALGSEMAVEVKLDPNLWPVWVDPTELELAVLNIAIFARDVLNQTGRLVLDTSNTTIQQTTGDLPPGEYASIAVRVVDLPSRDIPQHMEPTSPLNQVIACARALGGNVSVSEDPGELVRLYLPRCANVARDDDWSSEGGGRTT
ncbi:MAG: hypothetical protein KGJ78_15425 [Alphaproteobacteria bacterium]|nr:hypothetical protein [Alphaproteobacteria bacterium]